MLRAFSWLLTFASVNLAQAKLRLGVAMLQSGKAKANAVKQLRSVQGTDGVTDVARAYIALGAGQ